MGHSRSPLNQDAATRLTDGCLMGPFCFLLSRGRTDGLKWAVSLLLPPTPIPHTTTTTHSSHPGLGRCYQETLLDWLRTASTLGAF